MKKHTTLTAFIALLALVLLVYFGFQRQQAYSPQLRGPAVENFAARITDAKQVEIRNNDKTITLQALDDGWGLIESGNYPIKIDQLRSLIASIEQSQRIEARSQDSTNYASYGLSSEQATSISIFDGKENLLASLQLGSPMTQLDGTYALIGEDPQVWVISKIPTVSATASDWLVADVVNISADQIQEVQVSDATLTQVQGTLVLDNLGSHSPNQPNINQLGGALVNLRLLNATIEQPDLSGDTSNTTFITKDGLSVSLSHGVDAQNNTWAKLSSQVLSDQIVVENATSADATSDTSTDGAANDEQTQATDKEARLESALTQSESINQRVGNYWIQLPTFTGTALAYTRDDFIQKPTQEENEQ